MLQAHTRKVSLSVKLRHCFIIFNAGFFSARKGFIIDNLKHRLQLDEEYRTIRKSDHVLTYEEYVNRAQVKLVVVR